MGSSWTDRLMKAFRLAESGHPASASDVDIDLMVWEETHFREVLALEKKRVERSGNPFILMLLELGPLRGDDTGSKAVLALSGTTRETDVVGWYSRETLLLGALFTELGKAGESAAADAIFKRVHAGLSTALGCAQAKSLRVSFAFFPEKRVDTDYEQAPPGLHPGAVNSKMSHRDLEVSGGGVPSVGVTPHPGTRGPLPSGPI